MAETALQLPGFESWCEQNHYYQQGKTLPDGRGGVRVAYPPRDVEIAREAWEAVAAHMRQVLEGLRQQVASLPDGVSPQAPGSDFIQGFRAAHKATLQQVAGLVSAALEQAPQAPDLAYLRACEHQNFELLDAIGYPHEKDSLTAPEEYAAQIRRKAAAFDASGLARSFRA